MLIETEKGDTFAALSRELEIPKPQINVAWIV